ncbi:MAG: nucleotidyltransferase [Oscillospiraceae bacterium]|nr:nucleotidyltransferase [Oscillospiraceae bacterium]
MKQTEPALVIMAAGMGSRFGGLKQLEPVGPNGEIILDYSVHDARVAGFRKAILIIKEENAALFRQTAKKAEKFLDTRYAFQKLEDLPNGFTCPQGRTKPWGTGHAVLSAANLIDGPFAVINADDYYGPEAFRLLYGFLSNPDLCEKSITMVAFELSNTVTEYGSVSRGVCEVNADGLLTDITERADIIKQGNRLLYLEDGSETELAPGTLVSMNCWGFTHAFLGDLQEQFVRFLSDEQGISNNDRGADFPELNCRTGLKREFFIPSAVNSLIREKGYTVKVMSTPDKWYGVTYKEDKTAVVDALKNIRV